MEDEELETSPANAASPIAPNDASNTEISRHNRRSRILHIGRMRHATPDERIEALRRLRNEDRHRAAEVNIEEAGQSVGERTLNRIGARLSRAFGGSRPASGISGPTSRPVSQAPAAPAAMETTSPATEAHSNAVEAPATSAVTDTRFPVQTCATSTQPQAGAIVRTAEPQSEPDHQRPSI